MKLRTEANWIYIQLNIAFILIMGTIAFTINQYGFHWSYLILFPLIFLFYSLYFMSKITGIKCPKCKKLYGVHLYMGYPLPRIPKNCVACGIAYNNL